MTAWIVGGLLFLVVVLASAANTWIGGGLLVLGVVLAGSEVAWQIRLTLWADAARQRYWEPGTTPEERYAIEFIFMGHGWSL